MPVLSRHYDRDRHAQAALSRRCYRLQASSGTASFRVLDQPSRATLRATAAFEMAPSSGVPGARNIDHWANASGLGLFRYPNVEQCDTRAGCQFLLQQPLIQRFMGCRKLLGMAECAPTGAVELEEQSGRRGGPLVTRSSRPYSDWAKSLAPAGARGHL
jgi:hypothetical protein